MSFTAYIIFGADVTRDGRPELDHMDPTLYSPTFSEFVVTESSDDGSEYDYLIDESPADPCRNGCHHGWEYQDIYLSRGLRNLERAVGRAVSGGLALNAEPCERCGGTGLERERLRGFHRKWVGELTWERWLEFAERYCIDLDDAGIPERYEDTMGSLTEYGHIPAICVDNSEGWSHGDEIIDSNFYISMSQEERA